MGVVAISAAIGIGSARILPSHAAAAAEHATKTEAPAEPAHVAEVAAGSAKEPPAAHAGAEAAEPAEHPKTKDEPAAKKETAEVAADEGEKTEPTEKAEKNAPHEPAVPTVRDVADTSPQAALLAVALASARANGRHVEAPHAADAAPVEHTEPAHPHRHHHDHAHAASQGEPVEPCEAMTDFAARAAAVHELSAAEDLYRNVLACNARYTPALIGNADAVWLAGDRTAASLLYRAIVDNFPDHLYPARVAVRAAPTPSDE